MLQFQDIAEVWQGVVAKRGGHEVMGTWSKLV